MFKVYFYELKPIYRQFMTVANMLLYGLGGPLVKFANPMFWLLSNINRILEQRQTSGLQRKDYVQILLESLSEDVNRHNDFETVDFTQTKLEKKMTIDVSPFFIVKELA